MSIKLVSDKVSPKLSSIQRELPKVVQQTYRKFVSVTPKDSGNARAKTRLKGNIISADYAYAKVLDKGYSKQAPQGMVKPAVAFLRQLLTRIIRK